MLARKEPIPSMTSYNGPDKEQIRYIAPIHGYQYGWFSECRLVTRRLDPVSGSPALHQVKPK